MASGTTPPLCILIIAVLNTPLSLCTTQLSSLHYSGHLDIFVGVTLQPNYNSGQRSRSWRCCLDHGEVLHTACRPYRAYLRELA